MAPVLSGTFTERFLSRSGSHGRLCVGMDPHLGILEAWGLSPDVAGLEAFSRICVEAFADLACVVKPQVAFYEAFGSAALAVLEESISALRAAGVLVIADAKRGDIGSTMQGYARAWLDPDSPLSSDALTVSPYLGFGSLEAAFELGERHNRGVIVLGETSNPEAPQVQHAVDAGGRRVSQAIVDEVAERNRAHAGRGNVGVVIGATLQDPPALDEVGGMILMPGVGAQGATMADVRRIAGAAEALACPNVSRAVLKHGPDVEALRAAMQEISAELG